MGGSVSSSTVVNQVKTALGVEMVNKIENTCSVLADNSQTIRISGVNRGHFEDITQENFLENTCQISSAIEALQDIEGTQDLIQQLEKEQDTTGLFAISADNTNVLNQMELEVGLSTINDIKNQCKANFSTPQLFEAIDSSDLYVKGITQSNKQYNECIQGNDIFQETKAKLNNEAQSGIKVSQKTTGLDIAGILSALMWPMIILGGMLMLIFFVPGSTPPQYLPPPGGRGPPIQVPGQSGVARSIAVFLFVLGLSAVAVYVWFVVWPEYKPEKVAECEPPCEHGDCVAGEGNNPGGCKCKGNWEGPFCNECPLGYLKNGDRCGPSCSVGYQGPNCAECAPGFQKMGLACTPLPPSNNTSSSNTTGNATIPTGNTSNGIGSTATTGNRTSREDAERDSDGER